MPTRIDAAFRSAQDITLDAFRAPDEAAGDFRDVTIEVNGRSFRVSFANPSAPDVNFASNWFFNVVFNRSSRTAVRTRIAELVAAFSERRDFVRDVGRSLSAVGFRDNVTRTLEAEREAISKAAGGKMAVYGFTDVRAGVSGLVNRMSRQEVDGETVDVMRSEFINGYNEDIGLPGTNDSAARTIVFVRDNDRGRWDYGQGQDGLNVKAADKDEWAAYLRGKDVDLFSKIRRARAEAAAGKRTGWAGEIARQGLLPAIHDMVRKNIDPRLVQENPDVNFVLGAVAEVVAEAADADFGELDMAGVDARLREIVARHAPAGKEEFVKRVFDNVATTAFWRQTSKLGLDFFKARGQTVVFDWTTFDGMRSDGAELEDKWWKRGDEDVGDRSGAAITNSEMRHLSGAKYAAKPGPGRLVRIEGSLAEDDARREAAARFDSFAALDRPTLVRVVANLEDSFALADAQMFREAALDAIRSQSIMVWSEYCNGEGDLVSPMKTKALCERVFDRLKARIAGATSLAAKAALLADPASVFQAELLKDREIAEKIDEGRASKANEYRHGVASSLALRQLAGVDRGFGGKVFFSQRTGKPNELGRALLAAGDDVLATVRDFRRTVAAALGVAEENLFGTHAFTAFVMRASREAGGDLKKIVSRLGTIRVAADARAAVDERLRTRPPMSAEAKQVFDRRGEWDLDRLVYNEAVAAMESGSPVDVDRLVHVADVIRDLCERTAVFVDDFARRLNPDDIPELRLTEDDVARLTDAYLDREGSAVNSFRLTGRDEFVARFEEEATAALLKVSTLILELQDRANSYRIGARALRGLAYDFRTRFRLGLPTERRAPAQSAARAEAEAPEAPAEPPPPPAPPLDERRKAMLARVKQLEERAAELDARADQLTAARLKSVAVNAVATRGGLVHATAALAVVRALGAGGPLPMGVGETQADRLANFSRAFADRIWSAWNATLLEAARDSDIGFDDGNTTLKMAFAVYLRENPDVRRFLDREADDSLVREVKEKFEDTESGDPIWNVLDTVLAHGGL